MQKIGSEVTLRNKNGVELKQNSALVKKYDEQESVSVDAGPSNAHQGEIQESTQTGKGGDQRSIRQVCRPFRFSFLSLRD